MNTFEGLVGQNQATELLSQAIAQNRVAPAYLFAGPDGVGRSWAARCFAELLFCQGVADAHLGLVKDKLRKGNHPDLLWVEPTYLHQGQRLSAKEATAAGVKRRAKPQIRLEQIREISQFLSRPPLESERSLVVLEQAETMAEAAANGLLKTLEEPGQATLILIAPAADSLLPTLVSRCQRIPFYRLTQKDLSQVLQKNGHAEILQQPSVLAIAQGSPGEAIASWQQLQAISADFLQKVTAPPKSPRTALELAKEIDKNLDAETQLWLVDYLQHSYWQKFLAGAIDRSPLPQLEKARSLLLSYAQPRLVWEVTLLGMVGIQ